MSDGSISYYWSKFGAYAAFPTYRIVAGFPFYTTGKREILSNTHALDVIKLFREKKGEFSKGFKPYAGLCLTFYTQPATTFAATKLVPTDLSPATRGFLIGWLTSSFDAALKNPLNSIFVRVIEHQKPSEMIKEGPRLLWRGITFNLLHRWSSGIVFWSLYEPLHKRMPDRPLSIGFAVGLIQTAATSPFYIAYTLSQSKFDPFPGTYPIAYLRNVARTRGVWKGLFLRGLLPRSLHSAITSAPLMYILEKYNLIHR